MSFYLVLESPSGAKLYWTGETDYDFPLRTDKKSQAKAFMFEQDAIDAKSADRYLRKWEVRPE